MADTFTLDASDFLRNIRVVERSQLPQATVWALNDTAQDILSHVQERMDVVFDRPTRFTKNALMVWRATKRTMRAEVKERPSVGRRHYLKVQEGGGARPQTGLERMLTSTLAWGGVLGAVVPAAGAKLNAHGNWSPGERNQAISAIQGWREVGYSANTTAASAKRKKGRRAAYFVPRQGGKLSPGIWKRTGKGKSERISKVAHFVSSAPVYRERLGFYDGAETVFADRFPVNFERAFARALATRR